MGGDTRHQGVGWRQGFDSAIDFHVLYCGAALHNVSVKKPPTCLSPIIVSPGLLFSFLLPESTIFLFALDTVQV